MDTKELIKQLSGRAKFSYSEGMRDILEQAADKIEAQAAEIDRLGKHLEARHYYNGALGFKQMEKIEALTAEIERLKQEAEAGVFVHHTEMDALRNERDTLQAKLDALAKQEPALEVERMPDHWSGGYFYDYGGSYISEAAISKLPIGTKLYTAPKAQEPI